MAVKVAFVTFDGLLNPRTAIGSFLTHSKIIVLLVHDRAEKKKNSTPYSPGAINDLIGFLNDKRTSE